MKALVDPAWRDRVHGDAVDAELGGEGAGERLDGALGGRVGREAAAAADRALGELGRIMAGRAWRLLDINVTGTMLCDTDMSRDVMTPEYRARRLAELPLHRFGSVDDVAYCALVLASVEAGYLTGQILHPSGGWVSG